MSHMRTVGLLPLCSKAVLMICASRSFTIVGDDGTRKETARYFLLVFILTDNFYILHASRATYVTQKGLRTLQDKIASDCTGRRSVRAEHRLNVG
jgi:hypothetical protein